MLRAWAVYLLEMAAAAPARLGCARSPDQPEADESLSSRRSLYWLSRCRDARGSATIALVTSATANAPPEIEAVRVHAGYGAGEVVSDVSLAVARGECVGVIGPNGA